MEADEDVATATASAPLALRRSTRVAATAVQAPQAPSAPISRTNNDSGTSPAQRTGTQQGHGPSQESSGNKSTQLDEHGTGLDRYFSPASNLKTQIVPQTEQSAVERTLHRFLE
ncbi:hypothetical protein DFH06DRAFT_1322545 [Mycena polygramma]|nr:hypothetical protein DFH06DRAFT_1322545 [Mycena polygramma]